MGLPPLRAMQAFAAFGKAGSVHGAARALGVTPGAISQQLRLLEEHVGVPLILREGRRITMTPAAMIYYELIAQGFDRLDRAQDFILNHRITEELVVSGLPTLLQKWLNPVIHRFQAMAGEPAIRIIATHKEPDPQLMDQMFRLTYGRAAQRYPYSRSLFTDACFPACAPGFLAAHPEAATAEGLMRLPLIGIDWGMEESVAPGWDDWFTLAGLVPDPPVRTVAVYSMSSLALEAAAAGQGVVLAQDAFAQQDIDSGRLVRLSEVMMTMPESYFICWGSGTLSRRVARDFLNWSLTETRSRRSIRVEPD
ncbi:MAG: LysR family transcriptional regulator [Paracoccus sp. (in: a-proteobacteria)]|nr:LysR family transcriptional regulator [Paracoccus sp. (in: a-proteobacteria)]